MATFAPKGSVRLSKADFPVLARTIKRVLGLMLKKYPFSCLMVVVCIIGSALATLRGTLFLQSLIDDYILPLTQSQTPDFSSLGWALLSLALTYFIGIFCAYAYNRIMVNVSQGTMRNLASSCSGIWNPCRSAILTPMPTETSCRFIPTTWIRSDS